MDGMDLLLPHVAAGNNTNVYEARLSAYEAALRAVKRTFGA